MTGGRDLVVEHLTRQWRGPAGGEDEILHRSPVYAYLVGVLFPVEKGTPRASTPELDEPLDTEVVAIDVATDDDTEPLYDEVDEDAGLSLTGAFGWAPQSLGLSLIHDAGSLTVTISAGVYELTNETSAEAESDTADERQGQHNAGAERWKRRSLPSEPITIDTTGSGSRAVWDGRAMLSWRNRRVGSLTISTLAISNAATCDEGEAKTKPADCLFQVRLEVETVGGRVHPYPESSAVNASDEELELELRYESRATYAIGHGTSASWEDGPAPQRVWSESIPVSLVPAIKARESNSRYLLMHVLGDESSTTASLTAGLREFSAHYERWVESQAEKAARTSSRLTPAARAIVDRQARAHARIAEGIATLESNPDVLVAFRLANQAMRHQMLQSRVAQDSPGKLGEQLPVMGNVTREPAWHPFQLAFILAALASTVDPGHEERELVDLIWFPTGGGKTEAYLGLAAIEMIRRRLVHGPKGGGTAIITRYTMRLLTAQQFQRAATLICSLELLRTKDERLRHTPPFSIGLWLGNSTTPGTYKQAADEFKRVRRAASPENPFQFRQCAWCGTPIMPTRLSRNDDHYGVRTSTQSFEFFCPHPDCDFHKKLPVNVVDEAIFDNPPTMLVATVDKFARLAWIAEGANLFGLGGAVSLPPSLVIQDELHLITGPLGTIVGVYEAAIRALMTWLGAPPKVVASTATTRAAAEQIRELMGTDVAVFPPSGIDADDNYYSVPDDERPGRLYVGLMPQAHTPSWAIGQICTELLQSPVESGLSGPEKDAYWTLVVYHNSLRELGRTMTILRDDVRSALERRALSSSEPVRQMSRDGVEELNGNVDSTDLLRLLDQLSVGPDSTGQSAIDALATTNILSVGIDVSRLGLMLVNGHPKSTSEYIQATSRVGRGAVPGLVVTMFRSGKPRDRSVFESFRSFHQSYYRHVEPASVTPWSTQARRRALRAALVMLMRHGGGLSTNSAADQFDAESAATRKAITLLAKHINAADKREAAAVRAELEQAAADWVHRAAAVRAEGKTLKFRSRDATERLLKQFTDEGVGWPTMSSMRSVDRVVRVRANGERR